MDNFHFKSSSEKFSTQTKLRFLIYAIFIVGIIITIIIWQVKLNNIKNQSQNNLTQIQNQAEENLKNALSNSNKSQFELVNLGKKYLENNPMLASAIFLKASQIDQNYRDAAFYSGVSYLKWAEKLDKNLYSTKDYQTKIQELYTNALAELNKAKDLDPLYKPTYEFLAYTYSQLHDEKNTETCYNRLKEFNQ